MTSVLAHLIGSPTDSDHVDGGESHLVALVHGLEDGWETWRPLVAHLGPRWRYRALDLPWRAGNGHDWRNECRAAEWVAHALAGLETPPSVLIGHSFGANALLDLAATGGLANRPRAMILVAPFFRPVNLPVTWAMFDRARQDFDRQMRAGMLTRLGPRASAMDSEVLEAMLAKTVDRVGPSGFLAVFEQFTSSGLLPLASVDIPTLVLAGMTDPSLGERRAAALARAMPAATVVVEPDWDHFCHVRQAAAVAHRISRFVTANGAAGACPHERNA